MPITRNMRNLIAAVISGETPSGALKVFGSTGAVLFVGCSTASHSATSTFLAEPHAIATYGPIAATMDAGYPSRSCGVITYRFTFSTCAAAAKWGEWGLYNATASGTDGTLFNRYPDNLGTKSTSASWQITITQEFTT